MTKRARKYAETGTHQKPPPQPKAGDVAKDVNKAVRHWNSQMADLRVRLQLAADRLTILAGAVERLELRVLKAEGGASD